MNCISVGDCCTTGMKKDALDPDCSCNGHDPDRSVFANHNQ